jgi:transcriptional regulator with XRE-family HTH domain
MTPEKIKARMKEKKLNQNSLAKRLGVSQTSVNFLIHGKPPSEKLEKRFARALGLNVEELRGEVEAA